MKSHNTTQLDFTFIFLASAIALLAAVVQVKGLSRKNDSPAPAVGSTEYHVLFHTSISLPKNYFEGKRIRIVEIGVVGSKLKKCDIVLDFERGGPHNRGRYLQKKSYIGEVKFVKIDPKGPPTQKEQTIDENTRVIIEDAGADLLVTLEIKKLVSDLRPTRGKLHMALRAQWNPYLVEHINNHHLRRISEGSLNGKPPESVLALITHSPQCLLLHQRQMSATSDRVVILSRNNKKYVCYLSSDSIYSLNVNDLEIGNPIEVNLEKLGTLRNPDKDEEMLLNWSQKLQEGKTLGYVGSFVNLELLRKHSQDEIKSNKPTGKPLLLHHGGRPIGVAVKIWPYGKKITEKPPHGLYFYNRQIQLIPGKPYGFLNCPEFITGINGRVNDRYSPYMLRVNNEMITFSLDGKDVISRWPIIISKYEKGEKGEKGENTSESVLTFKVDYTLGVSQFVKQLSSTIDSIEVSSK